MEKLDKLIELLNEYENYLDTTNRDDIDVHFRHINWADVRCFHNYSLIISKRYLFIKWLVDNDKIGDNKKSDRYTMMKLMRAEINEGEVFEGTERYEFVIMILSIQDEPIEFLISILK